MLIEFLQVLDLGAIGIESDCDIGKRFIGKEIV